MRGKLKKNRWMDNLVLNFVLLMRYDNITLDVRFVPYSAKRYCERDPL